MATAQSGLADPNLAVEADVVFLGEQHDNPAHHRVQAEWVAALAPKAIVFEMLTPEQAAKVTPTLVADGNALARALEWESSGWPDFTMYHPIFLAAPQAQIFGAAIPRDKLGRIMSGGVTAIASTELIATFDLDQPLSEAQQTARLTLQDAAHCGAMPSEMLPVMITIQRVRDAMLAQAALAALDQTGGRVVVIAGNGHVRADWGAPQQFAKLRKDVSILAVGQGEADTAPDGEFDVVLYAPPVDRGDPCAALR